MAQPGFYLGRCYWFEARDEGEHPHVVCSFETETGDYLVINFSSIKPNAPSNDLTLVMKAGEHPILTVDSFLYFTYAFEVSHRRFEELVAASEITLHHVPFSSSQIAAIQNAIKISKELPRKYRRKYSP